MSQHAKMMIFSSVLADLIHYTSHLHRRNISEVETYISQITLVKIWNTKQYLTAPQEIPRITKEKPSMSNITIEHFNRWGEAQEIIKGSP